MKNKKTILTIVVVLILDIISKLLISNLMLEEQSIKIINNFFYLTYARNTGVAFSFLEGNIPFIITITILIIIILIKYISSKELPLIEQISYGLIIGGALGNLIDRVVYGYVVDFLDFYIFNYNYPIFNIADCSIVIGIIIYLIISLKTESSDKDEINSRKSRKNR